MGRNSGKETRAQLPHSGADDVVGCGCAGLDVRNEAGRAPALLLGQQSGDPVLAECPSAAGAPIDPGSDSPTVGLTRSRAYYPGVSWVRAYQRVTIWRLCKSPTCSTAMNLLHTPRATNLSNANHRVRSRYPDVGFSGSSANQSGTARVTPEDELPCGATAGLSFVHTVSHIGNDICAGKWDRAQCSRCNGCRDKWRFHGPHPLG